jgi:hypothetical protein
VSPCGPVKMHSGNDARVCETLRTQHGCTAHRVMRMPADGNDLFVTHEFPTAEQAGSFAHDPALRAGMQAAGVEGAPRIEIFTDV